MEEGKGGGEVHVQSHLSGQRCRVVDCVQEHQVLACCRAKDRTQNDMLSVGRMSTLHYLNLKIFRHEQKVGIQVNNIIYCT